jgi:thioredoxin-dependent peroxiredoxin
MKRLISAALAATALLATAPAFADLPVGAKAPDFAAQGMKGGEAFTFKLADALKSGPVVVYFFPAAYTQGCTVETKLFADAADEFKAAGATLVGLTAGARMADGSMAGASENLARLAEFSAEHCRDKFPIAAISKETIASYDVSLPQRPDWSERTSYVIGQDGKIALAYNDMKPNEHVAKTLEAVKAIKAAKKS